MKTLVIAVVGILVLVGAMAVAGGRNAPSPAQGTANADAMRVAGEAMNQVAQGMETAAALIAERERSGDAALAELGRHWAQDAQALHERAGWLMAAAGADSMVHDPNKAQQLNLYNLRANGSVMVAEGQAMVEHGREMKEQVGELLTAGAIGPELADKMTAAADALIASGETLERDGKRMQDSAERLLTSLGK
jgi:hypothetical protein